jgi:hypothetical protein
MAEHLEFTCLSLVRWEIHEPSSAQFELDDLKGRISQGKTESLKLWHETWFPIAA